MPEIPEFLTYVDARLLQVLTSAVAHVAGVSCVAMDPDGKRLVHPCNTTKLCGGDRHDDSFAEKATCLRQLKAKKSSEGEDIPETKCQCSDKGVKGYRLGIINYQKDDEKEIIQSDGKRGAKQSEFPPFSIYRCHAGLVDFDVPIYRDLDAKNNPCSKSKIARFSGGQVILSRDDIAEVSDLINFEELDLKGIECLWEDGFRMNRTKSLLELTTVTQFLSFIGKAIVVLKQKDDKRPNLPDEKSSHELYFSFDNLSRIVAVAMEFAVAREINTSGKPKTVHSRLFYLDQNSNGFIWKYRSENATSNQKTYKCRIPRHGESIEKFLSKKPDDNSRWPYPEGWNAYFDQKMSKGENRTEIIKTVMQGINDCLWQVFRSRKMFWAVHHHGYIGHTIGLYIPVFVKNQVVSVLQIYLDHGKAGELEAKTLQALWRLSNKAPGRMRRLLELGAEVFGACLAGRDSVEALSTELETQAWYAGVSENLVKLTDKLEQAVRNGNPDSFFMLYLLGITAGEGMGFNRAVIYRFKEDAKELEPCYWIGQGSHNDWDNVVGDKYKGFDSLCKEYVDQGYRFGNISPPAWCEISVDKETLDKLKDSKERFYTEKRFRFIEDKRDVDSRERVKVLAAESYVITKFAHVREGREWFNYVLYADDPWLLERRADRKRPKHRQMMKDAQTLSTYTKTAGAIFEHFCEVKHANVIDRHSASASLKGNVISAWEVLSKHISDSEEFQLSPDDYKEKIKRLGDYFTFQNCSLLVDPEEKLLNPNGHCELYEAWQFVCGLTNFAGTEEICESYKEFRAGCSREVLIFVLFEILTNVQNVVRDKGEYEEKVSVWWSKPEEQNWRISIKTPIPYPIHILNGIKENSHSMLAHGMLQVKRIAKVNGLSLICDNTETGSITTLEGPLAVKKNKEKVDACCKN